MNITNQQKKDLFYGMLRIRRIQERIESLYHRDEMKTPIHLCIGQEAIAVGVCSLLGRSDYISSNHRSHGHYLAKGGDLNALIAELHCRKSGCSKGFGGSMHLVDISVGHLGSSSIVGGGIPIGTGLGLSIKMKRDDLVSVVFFGDGAADEGVLYESINFAMLKKLPVIFVLENNEWSVCSHVSVRQPTENVFHGVREDYLLSARIDGNDVLEVYRAASAAIERARKGLGPSFIECLTYRILGHAGSAAQDAAGYRDPEEIEKWRQRCPVKNFQQSLAADGIIDRSQLNAMEKRIADEIDGAFAFAEKEPLPDPNEMLKYVFCD
jgi:acetoin:2,6-dichlorophenolindophenol oxidoreductase subunit alpha